MEQQEKGELTVREDYEMKLSKYRDIVRKKDELLTKHQQKIEELLKTEGRNNSLQHELNSIRESFLRLKQREELQTNQLAALRKKSSVLDEGLRDKEVQFRERQEALMFSEEKLRRATAEFEEQGEESNSEIAALTRTSLQLKSLA